MLNQKQKEAVEYFSSNLLVIAGAGTGKTTVITEKVKFLIEQIGINPNSILAITFTNKAANEMKYRIFKAIGRKLDWIMTFHSFALQIIKTDPEAVGLDPNFVVYDENDQLKIIKDIKKEMGLTIPEQDLISAISLHKEGKKPINQIIIKEFYDRYQEKLAVNNAVDFDDILNYAVELLETHEHYREFWKYKFDYMMVDEFQDTNRKQLELIKLLYRPNSLMVVGDPNQTIYSWRGSEIQNILNFAKEFDAKIIKLEENYRSTGEILRYANELMKGYIPESVLPVLQPTRPKGYPPVIKSFKSDTEQAERIAKTISEYLIPKEGYRYKDIAILIRNQFLTSEIERKLMEYKIPYKILTKTKFQDRFEIKLLLSYLRFAINPKDTISFDYCVNVPARGLGKKSIEKLEQMYEKDWIYTITKNIEEFKNKQQKGFKEFLELITKLQEMIKNNDVHIIDFLAEKIDIKTILEKRYKVKQQVTKKLNSVETLSEMIKEKGNIKEVIDNLSPDKDDEMDEDAVIISTIHSAKGLEFPVVFIPALEKGIYPRSGVSKEEFEEERRVLYVAMTRAKNWLFISYAHFRKGFDGVPKRRYPSLLLTQLVQKLNKPAEMKA